MGIIRRIDPKSDIKLIHEDTSLDDSIGIDLNILGGNYGVFRPPFGFTDPLFRAAIRKFGFKSKLVRTAFETAMEMILGPKKTVVTSYVQHINEADTSVKLASTAFSTEIIRTKMTSSVDPDDAGLLGRRLWVYNADKFENGNFDVMVDAGSVDGAGLPNEEEAHVTQVTRAVITTSAGGPYSYGGTSLVLTSSAAFPVFNYPYPVIVDLGLPTEEIVQVINNNTGTNTLTLDAPGFQVVAGHTAGGTVSSCPMLVLSATVNRYHAANTMVELRRPLHRELPQLGTILINPYITGEDETLEYSRNDVPIDSLLAKTQSAQDHVVNHYYGIRELADEHPLKVGDTIIYLKIPVILNVPTTDFFVTLDDYKPNKETLVAGFYNTVANTITLREPLKFDHPNTVDPIVRIPWVRAVNTLKTAASATATYIVLNSTVEFPAATFNVIINRGGPTEEICVVSTNVTGTGTLNLSVPIAGLEFDHAVGELVEFGTVFIQGVPWDIFETNENKPVVRIPAYALRKNLLKDASWLHGIEVTTPVCTATLVGVHNIGDTVLTVNSLDGFKRGDQYIRSGRISINGDTNVEFVNLSFHRTTIVGGVLTVGGTTLVVLDSSSFPTTNYPYAITVDFGLGTEETVSVINNDGVNTFTLDSPGFIFAHGTGPTHIVKTIEKIVLALPLTIGYAGGEAVVSVQSAYGGTQLENGNTSVSPYNYQGHYVYDPAEDAPSSLPANLITGIGFLTAPFNGLQVAGALMPVSPASMFPVASLTQTFHVILGYGLGPAIEEVVEIKAINAGTNQLTINSSVVNAHASGEMVMLTPYAPAIPAPTNLIKAASVGDSSILIESGTQLPDIPFNIRLGFNTVNEETVKVIGKTATTRLKSLSGLSFGATSFTVFDDSEFSGLTAPFYVRIGRGQNIPDIRQSFLSFDSAAGATAVTVNSATGFPTANFFIQLSSYEYQEEIVRVSSVVGTTFNLETPLRHKHYANHDATLVTPSDTEEILKVTSGGTNIFNIDSSTPLKYTHRYAEPVELLGDSTLAPNTFQGISLDIDTVNTPLLNQHNKGELVEVFTDRLAVNYSGFFPEEGGKVILGFGTRNQEVVEYQGVAAENKNTLTFDPPIVFKYPHTATTSALGNTFLRLVRNESTPSANGSQFPLYLPPDKLAVFRGMFDMIRAAGVEVLLEEFH